MQTFARPRSPSPYSLSSANDKGADAVSLPSTEDDNKSVCTADSHPSTLVSETAWGGNKDGCPFRHSVKPCITESGQQPDFAKDEDLPEEPKVVWNKSKKRALGYFSFIHFIPVAITLVLFWLYLDGFQWKANDIQLKTLLFAAKLHESLIVISLGDILFHRIRYNLLTSRGVSFGLLVSPFRLTNPWSLLQAPFIASAGFASKSAPELFTVLLVILVSILALLTGPSSGVLMLPKYDWWQIPDSDSAMVDFKTSELKDASYFGAPYADLFPLVIDGRFGPDGTRDDRLEPNIFTERLGHILSGLDQILVEGMGISRANANITVVDGATADSFALAYQESGVDNCKANTCEQISRIRNTNIAEVKRAGIECADIICQSVAAQATSPLSLVTEKLFDRYRTWLPKFKDTFMIMAQPLDSKKADQTWRQPSVSMQCSTVLYDSATQLRPITFEHWRSFSPFSISPDGPLLEQIMQFESQDDPFTIYTDISRLLPSEVTVSTALLMYGGLKTSNPAVYLCLVDARWIKTQIWSMAPYATVMHSGVSMETLGATSGSNTTSTTISPMITITTEYANSLDTNLTVTENSLTASGNSSQSTPFKLIQTYCSVSVNGLLGPKCAMLAHTLYLTDSLRRTQSLFGYRTAGDPRVYGTMSSEPDKWTKLEYRFYHQLHAYKFEGSIIKLSMSVLLVHIMLVYTHLLLLVIGDGWYSRAWSELGELVALAVLSQPSPLLRNAGGGIRNWKTWKLRAFVREITPEGRLELVLKETVGSPRVLVELEEGQEKAIVEAEDNRKYG